MRGRPKARKVEQMCGGAVDMTYSGSGGVTNGRKSNDRVRSWDHIGDGVSTIYVVHVAMNFTGSLTLIPKRIRML